MVRITDDSNSAIIEKLDRIIEFLEIKAQNAVLTICEHGSMPSICGSCLEEKNGMEEKEYE